MRLKAEQWKKSGKWRHMLILYCWLYLCSILIPRNWFRLFWGVDGILQLSDLTVFVTETHKFESRYLDSLIGMPTNYCLQSSLKEKKEIEQAWLFWVLVKRLKKEQAEWELGS